MYKTISEDSVGLYKDRGSKFIAFAFHCDSEDQFSLELQRIKKSHRKSRHFCYAYSIDGLERCSDDGEPSGTAGKPILRQIQKKELKQIAVIVIRYFGGTLLGTGGLIQAYKAATADALAHAKVISYELKHYIKIEFEYRHLGPLMSAIKKYKLTIHTQELGKDPFIVISCHPDACSDIIQHIKASISKKYPSELHEDFKVEGLAFLTLDRPISPRNQSAS